MENGYQIHLPQFEGPFDLLLFFIERDELDIYNIPISKITNDFLDYIQKLETLQIEVAAEFIAMAARLMKIKAVTLLPRPQLDEKGDAIDPRKELVDRLVEYKIIKEANETLEALEDEQSKRFKRGIFELQYWKSLDPPPTDELHGITLFSLLKVYSNVVERYKQQTSVPKHVIQKFPYSVDVVKADMIHRVTNAKKIHFLNLVQINPDRYFVVFAFLCLLELVAQKRIKVIIGNDFNNFWLVSIDFPTPSDIDTNPEFDSNNIVLAG